MPNIQHVRADDCTGCGACAAVCPNVCIRMQADEEGFLAPAIRVEGCSSCGFCMRACPVCSPVKGAVPLKGYAATRQPSGTLARSSSGGLFYALAEYVVGTLAGVVCGAVICDDFVVRHKIVDTLQEVQAMQGSKYVQSHIDASCYHELESLLKQGRWVLFSGTPCQVHALHDFLKKEYSTLVTIDLVCHGVPSPWLLKQSLKGLQEQWGKPIRSVRFRTKDSFEKTRYCYSMVLQGNTKRIVPAHKDPFYALFMRAASLRECCYHCRYASLERFGDITLGDCASGRLYKGLLSDTALSTVLVNTPLGQTMWRGIADEIQSTALDIPREAQENHCLHAPHARPAKRDCTYKDAATLSYKEWKQRVCRQTMRQSIKHRIIRTVPYRVRAAVLHRVRRLTGKAGEGA